MVQAFSLPSSSLSYFIGWTLLHAEDVAIVSPWLSDVELQFPVNDQTSAQRLRLSEAISELDDTKVRVYVRSDQRHNDFIKNQITASLDIVEVNDLHAKAVVTSEYVYLGSANITYGGLELNRELCEVIENEHGSIDDYLDTELGL